MQETFWALVAQAKALDTTQICLALGVLFVAYLITVTVKKRNFPPGPWGLPVVGYLPYLTQESHLDFVKLGKKYGDVFSVNLGTETVVVLHGVDVIREALGKPEFLGRPPTGALKFYLNGSAFFVEDVHKWRKQRRFVVHSMKDLGLGRTVIEGDILNEIRHFIEILKSQNGKPMDLSAPLSPSISNNICSLVFGKRYGYEDPEGISLDLNLETATNSFTHTNFAAFFPWLLHFPYMAKILSVEVGIKALQNIKNILKKEIKRHKDTFDSKNIRDFIDSFIEEMESRKKKDPNTTLNDDTLACNVLDLFLAGSDTVRSSILWCVYVAAAYPDAQERIRGEILEQMGPDREPELRDMKDMSFTHSFMLEVMRWKTPVPLCPPHYTIADAEIGGYTIPKNTTVIPNLWNAHHSPDHWKEPESFVPDRFISKDGKTVSRPRQYMPFSMGRRVCPGEPMAIMELFLYFTSILQKFQIAFPEGYKPTYNAITKGIYALHSYKIRFQPRN